jgi:hypothetical protein
MPINHIVIIVSGLSDNTFGLNILTKHFIQKDIKPIVYSFSWLDNSSNYKQKMARLLQLIDKTYAKPFKLSLIGTSAGGSAAINAYCLRKSKIYKVINICGRLRVEPKTGYRSFNEKTRNSPAFAKSVINCEQNILKLAKADKHNIMTVRAAFGDELVPASTITISDAHNITIPTFEHVLSIAFALTFFSKPLIRFLKKI